MGIIVPVFTFIFLQVGVLAGKIAGDIILPPVLEGFGFPPDFGPVGSYSYTFQSGSHLSPAYDSQPVHYKPQSSQPSTYVDPYQPESPWIVDKIAAELGFVIPVITDSKVSALAEHTVNKIPVVLHKVPEHVEKKYQTVSKENYEKSVESEGSSSLDDDFGTSFNLHDFHFDFHSHDEDDCPHKDHDHHNSQSNFHEDSKFNDFEFAATKAQSSEDSKDLEEQKLIVDKKEDNYIVGGGKSEYSVSEKDFVQRPPVFKPSQSDPLFKVIPSHQNYLISSMAPYPYLHPSAATKTEHVKPTDGFIPQKKY